MLFPILEIEDIVQVGDQTRLNAVKSFVTKDESAITLVELEPQVGAGFIDITGNSQKDWYLDWCYDGITRDETATLQITTDSSPTPLSKTIRILSPADDGLFSQDTDLTAIEPDILKYVPEGKATFLNVHRIAQKKILEYLDEAGIVDVSGNKLTKASIVDVSEVSALSRDWVLHLIFKSLINSVDDVFTKKSQFYWSEVNARKARAILRLDLNNNGTLEKKEGISVGSMELIRR